LIYLKLFWLLSLPSVSLLCPYLFLFLPKVEAPAAEVLVVALAQALEPQALEPQALEPQALEPQALALAQVLG
jgi:uncharacterized membrane protein